MRFTALLAVSIGMMPAMVCPSAKARDVFVNNRTGSDLRDGTHADPATGQAGPVATLGRALRLAVTGDRIVLANTGQPYHESVTMIGIRNSGGVASFLVQGNGATLDGSTAIPGRSWEHYKERVYRFRPIRGDDAQQLFLKGEPLRRVVPAAGAKAPPPLADLQWCYFDGLIYFAAEPQKDPGNYPLSFANLPVGITLYRVNRVVIRDLTVRGFQQDGIHALNSCDAVTLENVVCRDNGRAGAAVGGVSVMMLDGCTLSGNGKAQFLSLPLSTAYLTNCQWTSDTAPSWVDQGGRVWFDGREIHGGLDTFRGKDASPPAKR